MTRAIIVAVAAASAAAMAVGCTGGPGLVLVRQVEARQFASDLRIQFTNAVDAANRAVMADTDQSSSDAAHAAMEARQRVQHDIDALRPILQDLHYTDEATMLSQFEGQFAEYRKLDDAILDLAVENTNLKAQRLSFTAAREASDTFRELLASLSRLVSPKDQARAEVLVYHAIASVLDVQVLQARHIAESDDAAMTGMEARMAASERAARTAVADLKGLVPASAAPALAEATTTLDRFDSVNMEIIQLSRRNTNNRSLALTLGEKRTLTLKCEAALQALTDRLTQHEFKATR